MHKIVVATPQLAPAPLSSDNKQTSSHMATRLMKVITQQHTPWLYHNYANKKAMVESYCFFETFIMLLFNHHQCPVSLDY